MTLVYLDTSFWLSATVTVDRNHQKALPILEKIRSGSYVALVSRHVLCEVLDVLKQRALASPGLRSAPDTTAHRSMVEGMYKEFISKVFGTPNVRMRDTSAPTVEILSDTAKVLKQVWGTIVIEPNCPVCRAPYSYLRYDCPGRDDALHVVIADKIGCDQLITFDRDFSLLAAIPQFSHLSIQVL